MQARQPHPPRFNATAPQQLRAFPGARGWDLSNAWCFIGSIAMVRRSRERKGSLICPLDIDPMAFAWPVDGIHGVLVRCDEERREKALRLVQAFLRDGAQMVCVLSSDAHTTYHYADHKAGFNNDGEIDE